MSLDLKDARIKITTETDCVLEAINRVSGRDRSEIVREVMHRWAMEKIHESSVLGSLLAREGLSAADQGTSGK
jgi:hypothetical protein